MTTEISTSKNTRPANAAASVVATWTPGSALIFVDVPKRNRQPAQGCFPMTD
ncbi:MAG TPA: hypothetical protein VEO95_13610 [Chthoniobacteraceae bacterium]|nr:hypothetical protein [Chthoniobacteraceae bacterium]